MRYWLIYLTIIAVVCGTLFAWVFSTQAQYRAQSAESKNRSIVQVVRSLETETESLEEEISGVRKSLDAAQQRSVEDNRLSDLSQKLQQAKLLAGLVDLEGPGIVVTLQDNRDGALRAQATTPAQYQPGDYIIHDRNVLYVVNELKAAGAEAITVNNQRLISNSDIRCVGTAILVNATRLVPPYEIKAIGNPDQLAVAVEMGQEYPFLKSKGFPVTLTKAQTLTIPAFRGSLLVNHLSQVQ